MNKGKVEKGRGLEKPSPHRKVVPSLPLLILLLLLLREEDVADGDVHLGNSQTNQTLNPPYDVRAHSLSYLVDGPTVLNAHSSGPPPPQPHPPPPRRPGSRFGCLRPARRS